MPEVIEGEATEVPSIELDVYHDRPLTLLGVDDPDQFVERAVAFSTALAKVVDQRGLYTRISGKKFVNVEGWTLLGSMMGVFPVLEQLERVQVGGVDGWQATVAAQTRAGEVVGRATSLCLRSEPNWGGRTPENAVASMAQTRATSKCMRAPLGFIMQLAGYQATPEAEIAHLEEPRSVPETPQEAPGADERQQTITGVAESVNKAQAAQKTKRDTKATLITRVQKGMEQLAHVKGWSRDEVMANANQMWGGNERKTFTDWKNDELLAVIKAMSKEGVDV